MRANRSDSGLERELRGALHRRGLRFRKHLAPVRGLRCQPDVVFTRQKVAVFVHGCFWHQCPEHATRPKANSAWWAEKLDGNVARDHRNEAALEAAGWQVVRLWEHQPIDEMVEAVEAALRGGPESTVVR
jgi:DNA mismatch endonuclease, patch repair protein